MYRSRDDALSIERSHILVRNKLKEAEVKEKKEGEKAATPAKAEKHEEKKVAKPEAKKAEPKKKEGK